MVRPPDPAAGGAMPAAVQAVLNSALLALVSRLGIPVLLAGGGWIGSEVVQLRRDVDGVQRALAAGGEMAMERRAVDTAAVRELAARVIELSLLVRQDREAIVEIRARVGAIEEAERRRNGGGPR